MIGNGDPIQVITSKNVSDGDKDYMWQAIAFAICASVCYGFTAIQSKYVAIEYPRLSLFHLNIHAQFLYGILLIPFFFIEESDEKSKITAKEVLVSTFGVLVNTIASISMGYSFKYGIAARVQAISAANLFIVLILARSLGNLTPNWLEFIGGLGVAIGVGSILSLYHAKE